MASLMGIGKAVDNLNKSVANLDKITAKGLNAVGGVEKAVLKAVNVPIMVALVLLCAAGVSIVISLERNIIFPALTQAFPVEGEAEHVNLRAFLASFIQWLIVGGAAGGFLLYKMRRSAGVEA